MMTDIISFAVRAGRLLLLMFLCRLLAQPLIDAAHAGDLLFAGWGILVALALMSSICTLALIKTVVDVVINLVGS